MRFPGFEGEWETERNEHLFVVSKEKNKSGKYTSVLSASQSEGMVERSGLGIDIKYEEDSVLGYKVVHPGDYVIHLRSFQGGFAFSEKTGICSPAYTILQPSSSLSYGFLKNYFVSKKFINSLRIVTYGIRDGKSISVEEWLKLSTCFPKSLEEQQRIKSFLSLLNKRITLQNKIIEDLRKLKAAIEDRCFKQYKGESVCLADVLNERNEKSEINNQYEVLSSTVSGIYSQRDYFNKDIASADNTGYKVIRRGDIVLSPQNLWMGNINYNDKFDIGIVSPSYKVFSIRPMFDSRFVASLLKSKKALWKYSLVSEQGASIVRRNLNIDGFMEITFPIPNKEEQNLIGDIISTVNYRIDLGNIILNDINRQKLYLLSQLFI